VNKLIFIPIIAACAIGVYYTLDNKVISTALQEQIIEEIAPVDVEALDDLIVEWTTSTGEARERVMKDIALFAQDVDTSSLPQHQRNFLKSIGL
jgi:hypothetical protein